MCEKYNLVAYGGEVRYVKVVPQGGFKEGEGSGRHTGRCEG